MLSPSDYCEDLRQRAEAVLRDALRTLALHPENTAGKMAPHVAIAKIRKAAQIASQLEALATAAEITP